MTINDWLKIARWKGDQTRGVKGFLVRAENLLDTQNEKTLELVEDWRRELVKNETFRPVKVDHNFERHAIFNTANCWTMADWTLPMHDKILTVFGHNVRTKHFFRFLFCLR